MTSSPLVKYSVDQLGDLISSWTYTPAKSKKFIGYALGIIGGLLIALLAYGRHLFPWLDKLGSGGQAIALLLLSPLFAYVMKMQKDMEYSLYEYGLVLKTMDKKAKDKGQIALWKDYDGCSFSDRGVRLSPKTWLKRPIFLRCTGNRMQVYTLCRERIDAFRFGHERMEETR